MQVTITFDPADKDEVAAAHRALSPFIAEAFGDEQKPASDKPAAKEKAKPAEKPKEEKPAAKEEKPADPPAEEKPEPKHDREAVREKLKEVKATLGAEAAMRILKDHGASSMPALDESKFDAAYDAAVAALGDGDGI